MLSAIITALLLCVMLLVIASLIINSLRERRRHMRSLAIQGQLPTHPLDHHVKMVLYMQETVVVGVEKPAPLPTFTHSSSWYIRHRTLVSISFLVMIFLTLFIQSGLADGAFDNRADVIDGTRHVAQHDRGCSPVRDEREHHAADDDDLCRATKRRPIVFPGC